MSYLAKLAMVAAVYFIMAKLGLELDAISKFAALIWPPTGIALAVLLLYGYRLWPGIFLGAFLINLVTGAPVLVALGIGIGNTLEAVVGAYLLKRFTDFHKSIDRLKDVVSLFALACVLSTVVSATIGVLSLWLGHVKSLEGIGVTWRAWWVGDALGDLIIAPLILVCATGGFGFKFDFWRIFEAILLGVLLVLSGFVILGESTPHPAFWFFPLAVWGALRFGQIGNVTVVFLISIIAVWGAVHDLGPFARGSLRDNLLFLDNFMIVIATTGLILAAALAERGHALEVMRKAVLSRDEFLSIASHELKTPLTSLSLQIQMTKQRIKPEKNIAPSPDNLAKVFAVSEKQVFRLTELVDELLDASRAQTGKFSFSFEKINLSNLIKDMVDRFSNQLKSVQCPLEIAIEENVIGYFDHARVEQIVDNLLSNAIKYAPGKLVKVSLSQNDKTVKLVVEDCGPGIPADKRVKIFERFERVSDSTSVKGLGLGLFIVREIVRGHNGSVRLESVNGTGSKFVVELPLETKS